MSRLWRLARKELSESLRDRRTILTLVLMPLLLYPVLAILLQQIVLGNKADARGPVYRVGFASSKEGGFLSEYWQMGRAWRDRRSPPEDEKRTPRHLRPEPNVEGFVPEDAAASLAGGGIDVMARVRANTPLHMDAKNLLFVDVELEYQDGSPYGAVAARYLEELTAEANAVMIGRGLGLMKIPQRGDPVRVSVKALPAASGPGRSQLVPVLVPLILILMTMTGAVYPAIDLTAGERERGTLEILAAAPIPRLSVLLAKYIAVLAVAMLTALANIGSMAVTLSVTGLGQALFGGSFGLGVLLQVLALLILFASFFSAVLLALCSFARSFKEAQAYLIPLMLVCMTPGVMALLPGLPLAGPLAVVPLLNIVLLARDVLEGTATPAVASVVVLITLLYALAAVGVAARVFATEAVVSSESSGWGDLLRRPAEASPHAAASSALLCLAVLFPATFLLTAALSRVGASAAVKLGLTGGASVALLAGFPLVAAWLGRVRPVSGFRLSAPGWAAWPAAVLLGVGLWPFVHEASLVTRAWGLTSLPMEQLAKLGGISAAWRTVPAWLVVLMMAVLPAVAEELLYRGYLWSAMSDLRPWQRILATSLLFAAFHLFVGQLLAVERFVPSLLMGVVLGVVAWRSGSVLPGMLLHALHNAALVLLAYYQAEVVAAGWLPAEDGHLSPALLGIAAGVVALGAVLLCLIRPSEEPTA